MTSDRARTDEPFIPQRVAVFGLGYVGTVTAACLAQQGHDVIGVDPDRAKVAAIQAGTSPIVEPDLDDLVAAGRAAGRLAATMQPSVALRRSDIAIVCVGTPSQWNGAVDLRHVEDVCAEIGHWLADSGAHMTVVFRSTRPPGTVDRRLVPVLETASGAAEDTCFAVAMCPEFLRESTAIADFFDPPYTVCGTRNDRVAAQVDALFGFLDRPFRQVSVATAEAVKYACNAFHATKITFANEIGRVTAPCGVDGREVMELVCADDRLNIAPAYLRPGFAFGGSCLPKDLRALLHLGRVAGEDLPMLAGVLTSNQDHVGNAVRGVLSSGARRVALLGLSFKPGTDDLRESPNVDLAETLLGKGVEVCIYDANVRLDRVSGANRAFAAQRLPHLARLLTDDPVRALDEADCAIVSTAEEAVVAALRANPPKWILDLCGSLPPDIEQHSGYWGAAWPGPVIDLREPELAALRGLAG
jgi:GDP-mannose 6-dehydrogenase